MNWIKISAVALAVNLGAFPVLGQSFKSLYSFPEGGGDGSEPFATLTVGPDGDLYGTTLNGGGLLGGTAFKVSVVNGAVSFLGDFDPATTGQQPYARLVNIGDGYLYGATLRNRNEAEDPAGTVYRLDPVGGLTPIFQVPTDVEGLDRSPTNPRAVVQAEPGALHVLCGDYPGIWRVPIDPSEPAEIIYTFAADSADGDHAQSLIRGSDGYLYGTTEGLAVAGDGATTRGTIFRIKPDGSEMTLLHDCPEETGTSPGGALVEGPDGNFYGTMSAMGANGLGCVYRISPEGDYTVLHHFKDLGYPSGELLLARDGFLYGTASGGGSNGAGGVFRIRLNGKNYEVLHRFKYTNGSEPVGGLVLAKDGALYGTTKGGGTGDNGTIFRLSLNLPVNRRPVAVDDAVQLTDSFIAVLKNDFDPDGDQLTVTVTSAPTQGTAVVQSNGSILYTPAHGGVVTDSFTYTISDGDGGLASATVRLTDTRPEKGIEAGVYGGLLLLDPELSGPLARPRARISLTVKDTGRFTGVLFTERKRVSFKGTFFNEQIAAVNVKLPGKRKGTLFLSAPIGTTGLINCTLFGAEICTGEAGLAQAPLSGEKEQYTVFGIPVGSEVEGSGYGVMKVSKTGTVTIAGKLGDGTKLSAGGNLISLPGRPELIPVFSEPLSGGVIGGYVAPQVIQGRNGYVGPVRWVRPKAKKSTKPYPLGFDVETTIGIVRYIAPQGSAPVIQGIEGIVTLFDAAPGGNVTGDFTLDGKRITRKTPLKALSINRKTGLFTGSIGIGRKTVKFGGAVHQAANDGGGYYVVGGESKKVELSTDESANP